MGFSHTVTGSQGAARRKNCWLLVGGRFVNKIFPPESEKFVIARTQLMGGVMFEAVSRKYGRFCNPMPCTLKVCPSASPILLSIGWGLVMVMVIGAESTVLLPLKINRANK